MRVLPARLLTTPFYRCHGPQRRTRARRSRRRGRPRRRLPSPPHPRLATCRIRSSQSMGSRAWPMAPMRSPTPSCSSSRSAAQCAATRRERGFFRPSRPHGPTQTSSAPRSSPPGSPRPPPPTSEAFLALPVQWPPFRWLGCMARRASRRAWCVSFSSATPSRPPSPSSSFRVPWPSTRKSSRADRPKHTRAWRCPS